MTTESRTRDAIASDLRECAEIWRKRAEQVFGNQSMVDWCHHAVLCAERFEAQLKQILTNEQQFFTEEPED